MASTTLISVSEYLKATYRPDCDYVDGRIEERNVGEHDHAALQAALILWFGQRQRDQRSLNARPREVVAHHETGRVDGLCEVRALGDV